MIGRIAVAAVELGAWRSAPPRRSDSRRLVEHDNLKVRAVTGSDRPQVGCRPGRLRQRRLPSCPLPDASASTSRTLRRSRGRPRCRLWPGVAGSAIRYAPPATEKILDGHEPKPSIAGTSRRRGKAGQYRSYLGSSAAAQASQFETGGPRAAVRTLPSMYFIGRCCCQIVKRNVSVLNQARSCRGFPSCAAPKLTLCASSVVQQTLPLCRAGG